MGDIQKLDYSKPPPGFRISGPPSHREHTQAAIRDAWAHYKANSDPPGMLTGSYGDTVFWVHVQVDGDLPVDGPFRADEQGGVSQAEAACRAAAWAWYDARLGLANTHSAAWPECLGYTDETCAELLEGPTSAERERQSEEHNASSLALLDYSSAPPGWVQDPNREWAYEADTGPGSKCRRRPIDVAWSHYKAEHNPPGMWCGFSRGAHEMETCSLRAGVSACGARWELMPDLRVPFKGYLAKCRAWAWAWHDRRHGLARRMMQDVDVNDVVQFHLILCWHDEWVAAVDAWLVEKSAPPPEALATLRRKQVRR